MKVEEIKKIFSKVGLECCPYEEDGKLCGYELEAYTERGGDMIHFLDFRGTDLSPYELKDIVKVFYDYVDGVDVDDEIEINLQSAKEYGLTTRELVKDYTDYFKWLSKAEQKLENISRKYYEKD